MQILLHRGVGYGLPDLILDVLISALPFPMARIRFPVILLNMQASTWLSWMGDYEKRIVLAHRLRTPTQSIPLLGVSLSVE